MHGAHYQVLKHGLAALDDDGHILVRDREMIVVEASGDNGDEDVAPAKMLTGRRHPSMVLIQVKAEFASEEKRDRVVRFSAPGMDDISVSLSAAKEKGKVIHAEVWGAKCAGVDLGQEVADWIREFLLGAESGRDIRVLWHPQEESSRDDQPQKEGEGDPALKPKDVPLYADGTPYLLLSKESTRHIRDQVMESSRTRSDAEELDYRRFRPNVLVEGAGAPFAEDTWAQVRVGSGATLRSVGLCPRCEFVNVDPDVGDRPRGGQPLKTLRQFRLVFTVLF